MATKTAFQKSKKIISDLSVIDPEKTYIFKLKDTRIKRTELPSRLMCMDDKGNIRELNLNPLEKSPWRDEQENKDYIERSNKIIFDKGQVRISGKEKFKIDYLLNLDWYEGKRGKINPKNRAFQNTYYAVDDSLRISQNRELRENIVKANNIVLEASLEDLRDFMSSEYRFDPYIDKKYTNPEDALYEKALQKATEQSDKFIKDFNNPKHKIKVTVIQGFRNGLLDDKEAGSIRWKDTGAEIYSHKDFGKRSYDVLTSWIINGDKAAEEFYVSLQAKLSKD